MTDQEKQRAKELSSQIASLGKPDKKIRLGSYFPPAEKEYVFESPQTLAAKLNSLPEGSLGNHLIKNPLSAKDVIDEIKKLGGNDRLDISNIRNGENLARAAQRQIVDMNDLRWHGSGGTTASSISVNNEVVSGSGTTFTLAYAPVINSQKIFAIGQRLTPTVDYTISVKTITMVSSWNAGDILADYIIL